ncbi:SPW repeat domain-containing protein [Modestobacter lapidis]|nr:hypothetical protein [Modestobacter lapidis]
MLREGPIPQAVQGLLEYLVGFLFVAAPFLLGFTDSGMATAASIVVGVVFLVLASTGAGPTGLVHQLGPPAHALLDAVLAVLLIAAPFVLGFSAEATPRNLFLVAGVGWLLVTIGSRYDRQPAAVDRPADEPAGTSGDPRQLSADDTRAIDAPPPSGSHRTAGSDPGARRESGPGTVGPGYGPLDGGRAG